MRSSAVFFSLLDVCCLLSRVHVHSPAMYTSHNNFSAGCCTWSGSSSLPHIIGIALSSIFISFTHHSHCTFIVNWFVADDSSLILIPFCYCWLSFRYHQSSLHKVYLLIVCFCFFFRLCVFVFSFACIFAGWVPILDLFLKGFSSLLRSMCNILSWRDIDKYKCPWNLIKKILMVV